MYETTTGATNTAASVPNTPEVQEFKHHLYTEAMRVARRHGWESQVRDILNTLGVEGPPVATVTGTVTLPFRVEVSRLFGEGVTADEARDRIERADADQRARQAVSYANYGEATVEYTVSNPDTPSNS